MKSGLTEFVGSALDGKIRIEDGIQGFRGFQTAATFRLRGFESNEKRSDRVCGECA